MSSSTAPSTPKTWNKTPPHSPRVLCEKTFPTPGDAAKIAAEERLRRAEILKARKAESALQATAPSAASQEVSEVAPPTPISLAQTEASEKGKMGQMGIDRSETSTTTSPDQTAYKQAKTKKLRNTIVLKKKAQKSSDGIEAKNRYEALSQGNKSNGSRPDPAEQEGLQGPPNSDLSASQQRPPKERKKSRRSETHEGATNRSQISQPSTPTPNSKNIGSPYDSSNSHHALLREMTRSERRASQQGVARNKEMEDLERWLQSGGIEALDQIARQEEEGLGLIVEGDGLHPRPPEPDQTPNPLVLVDHNGDQIMLQGESESVHPNTPEEKQISPTQQDPFITRSPAQVLPHQNVRKDDTQTLFAQPPFAPSTTTQTTLMQTRPVHDLFHDTPTPSPMKEPPPMQNYQGLNHPSHDTHRPTTHKLFDLEFSAPTTNFQLPRGNDPFYPFDNLSKEQTKEWPNSPGESVLVRWAGKGYPAANKEQARKEEILSLLRKTVGIPKGIRITAPSAATPETGNNKPPFNFLLYNLDEEYKSHLQSFGGCISTLEGTLFFATNGPVIDMFLGTIEGFDDEADEDQLRTVVNRAFNESDLNSTITALARTNDQLALLPLEIVIDMIRRSLNIKIVETKRQDNTTFRVAHLFLDSPTLNPLDWRVFRDRAMKSNFKDPFLGMNIRSIKCWICGICTSALHTKQTCPILMEPGWLYDPSINPPPTTTTQTSASQTPATTFTTITSGNRNGSERGGRGGKGQRGGN
ncbi:hypothetical protein BC835DRAFT_1309261 [Cytidiella melzeri]|nr:hypothetical protein BC835DRAFT_1309261 [Cytidiella melzeri]